MKVETNIQTSNCMFKKISQVQTHQNNQLKNKNILLRNLRYKNIDYFKIFLFLFTAFSLTYSISCNNWTYYTPNGPSSQNPIIYAKILLQSSGNPLLYSVNSAGVLNYWAFDTTDNRFKHRSSIQIGGSSIKPSLIQIQSHDPLYFGFKENKIQKYDYNSTSLGYDLSPISFSASDFNTSQIKAFYVNPNNEFIVGPQSGNVISRAYQQSDNSFSVASYITSNSGRSNFIQTAQNGNYVVFKIGSKFCIVSAGQSYILQNSTSQCFTPQLTNLYSIEQIRLSDENRKFLTIIYTNTLNQNVLKSYLINYSNKTFTELPPLNLPTEPISVSFDDLNRLTVALKTQEVIKYQYQSVSPFYTQINYYKSSEEITFIYTSGLSKTVFVGTLSGKYFILSSNTIGGLNTIVYPNNCNNCIDGYFCDLQVSNQCQKCVNSCKTCTKLNICTSCNDLNRKTGNKCQSCKDGFYFDSGDNKCKNCPSSCSHCSNLNICTACGYYISPVNSSICGICPTNCRTCSDVSACTSCKDQNKKTETQCTLCKDNYYPDFNDSSICKLCPSNCQTCTNTVNCTSCKDVNRKIDIQCTTCKDSYYPDSFDSNICKLCPSDCLTCTDATTCTACKDSKRKIDNQCSEEPSLCTEADPSTCNAQANSTIIDLQLTLSTCAKNHLIESIPNCQLYGYKSQKFNCIKCKSDSQFMSNVLRNGQITTQCVLKSVVSLAGIRCIRYQPVGSSHLCTMCARSYYNIPLLTQSLTPYNTCLWYAIVSITSGCQRYWLKDGKFICQKCKLASDSLILFKSGTSITLRCVPTSQISSIPNCQVYTLSNSVFSCQKCLLGYVFNANQLCNTCAAGYAPITTQLGSICLKSLL